MEVKRMTMKRLYTLLLAAFCMIALGTEQLLAQTNVPAVISTNQVWDVNGSPYLINQNTTIGTGASVIIKPGAVVVSSSSTNVLTVNGELRAEGMQDSLILFNLIQINLAQGAVPYNGSTGAWFNYCQFVSTDTARVISVGLGMKVRIENSFFYNAHMGVIIMSNSTYPSSVEINNCVFEDTTTQSFPVIMSLTSSDAEIDIRKCTFNHLNKGGAIELYGKHITFLHNEVYGLEGVAFTAKSSEISCNTFWNLRSSVVLNFYTLDSTSSHIFTHNSLDSFIYGPLLRLNKGPNYRVNQSHFNNNNFGSVGIGTLKILVYGINANPSNFEYLDFQENFWETTDSSIIEDWILDRGDSTNYYGRLDFSGYLSGRDTSCNDSSSSSCSASFYIAIDTTNLYALYVVNTSTGTTSNTNYLWDFGDGNTSTSANPGHTYANYGKYLLCLTLSNTAENCSSTYCDSIGLDSNGNLLKNGFTVQVINESDLTHIGNNKNLEEVRIYPNPSKGQLVVELAEASDAPVSVRIIDLSGKTVFTSQSQVTDGRQFLDLSTLKEGVYLLNIQQNGASYTTKIVISR